MQHPAEQSGDPKDAATSWKVSQKIYQKARQAA